LLLLVVAVAVNQLALMLLVEEAVLAVCVALSQILAAEEL
jgi:hypothetical protein